MFVQVNLALFLHLERVTLASWDWDPMYWIDLNQHVWICQQMSFRSVLVACTVSA